MSHKERTSKRVVSPTLARLIQLLEQQLLAEYGCDYSYSISGAGHLVGASNFDQGRVTPKVGKGRIDQKVLGFLGSANLPTE